MDNFSKFIEQTKATIPTPSVAEPPDLLSFDLSPDFVTVAATRANGGLTISRFIIQEYRSPTKKEIREGAPLERVPVGKPKEITPEFIDSVYARRQIAIDKGEKDPGDAIVSWRIVPNDFCDENTDRTFRNAWKDEQKDKPGHDMPKAREIHKVYLRKARLAEFCRLDNDYRIADEAGDQKAKSDIGAVRQKFRDVTEDPRIEACQTVEELKALRLETLVPETLGEKFMDKFRVSPGIEESPK